MAFILPILIKNGQFDKVFQYYYADTLKILRLSERTIIDLSNPTLSQKTSNALQAPTLRFRNQYLSPFTFNEQKTDEK